MDEKEIVFSDKKSRKELIREMYTLDFEESQEKSFRSFGKKYLLSKDETESNTEEVLFLEKIYQWYIPEINEAELDIFLQEMEIEIDELYDDPYFIYKKVNMEKDETPT